MGNEKRGNHKGGKTDRKQKHREVKQRQLCIAKKRRGTILETITQNIRSIRKDYQ